MYPRKDWILNCRTAAASLVQFLWFGWSQQVDVLLILVVSLRKLLELGLDDRVSDQTLSKYIGWSLPHLLTLPVVDYGYCSSTHPAGLTNDWQGWFIGISAYVDPFKKKIKKKPSVSILLDPSFICSLFHCFFDLFYLILLACPQLLMSAKYLSSFLNTRETLWSPDICPLTSLFLCSIFL